MKIYNEVSDEVALAELGRRIAQHRLNRNLTQAELARESGVSRSTVARLEQGESTQATNLIRILRVLDLLPNLEALIPEPGVSPLQQLKLRGKSRQRASRASDEEVQEPWSWGDEG